MILSLRMFLLQAVVLQASNITASVTWTLMDNGTRAFTALRLAMKMLLPAVVMMFTDTVALLPLLDHRQRSHI